VVKFIYKLIVVIFVVGCMFQPAHLVLAANETQAQLEQELRDIEQQISEYENQLTKTKSEKATLAGKIAQLQARQKSLTLQIKATSLKLDGLAGKITISDKKINDNIIKSQRLVADIGIILRQMNAVDEGALLAIMSVSGWSDIYNQIQDWGQLAGALNDFVQENKKVKLALVDDKAQLEEQKSDVSNLLQIQSIQRQGLLGSLGEQNQLFTVTKGKESNYQSMLNDSKKRAAALRSRIYELFNTGSQINFGQAVDMAKLASTLTGVRPAFLLAILTQESNLGKNVGTCNRSGDPPEKGWQTIMKPERDQEPFKTITGELGFDIDTTPVSCPMRDKNGKQIGWGGAMGPAQFIPSTWMGYRDKVKKLSGKSTANPWDIRDAFLAAGIKLKADGANGTETGEFNAAMRYFAGSVNLKYRFYGDNVLATAKKYEQDISEM